MMTQIIILLSLLLTTLGFLGMRDTRLRASLARYVSPVMIVTVVTLASAIVGGLVGDSISSATTCQGLMCNLAIVIDAILLATVIGFVTGLLLVLLNLRKIQQYFTDRAAPWVVTTSILLVSTFMIWWFLFGSSGRIL